MFIITGTPTPKEKQIDDYPNIQVFRKSFVLMGYCGLEFLFGIKMAFKLKSLFGMKKFRMNEWVALTVLFLFLSVVSYPQKSDTIKTATHFSGSVTLTTNGISTIPNFILGKPAAIFYTSFGQQFSFEPEFRFSLDAKPWMFIFWLRSDLLKSGRHHIRLGINSQINFNKSIVHENGILHEIRSANRFLSADLSQSYVITRKFSTGIYYMYSHTLEKFGLKDLHYLAFRGNFMNIALTDQVFMKFSPQVYYLRIDNRDGFYFSETLTLARKCFPLILSSIVTNPIKTRIPTNNHLVWNINLIYAFSNNYRKINRFHP